MKRALVLGITVALLLGACSSANGDATKSTKTTSTTSGADEPDPAFDSGDAVAIKTTGFEPRWLVVAVGQKVTFTNTTSTSQQIVFDNAFEPSGAPVQSPAIEAGGTWEWTAASFASFAYHSPNLPGVDGRIQVSPPAEP